ncbi:hypothetical protein CR194_06670 [Salipaludibacillus keqinensis]|jgi:hypothetical protein|uniref:Uncharacterized protein n=1 Tax=Salipaludibacillus keqinensis TaxID=2045207 RepID=A0A323TMS4_9BACI|nr:hypothetical protein [Salipaludibacillus keqinensis]PYZ95366.1 hypothetical protein CR194_06670 [Salipaludibacillus keqinensis]
MTPYLVIAGIVCIGALIGTILVGMNPSDENYDKKRKKHFTNLSIIYAATFIPALILTILYFIYG